MSYGAEAFPTAHTAAELLELMQDVVELLPQVTCWSIRDRQAAGDSSDVPSAGGAEAQAARQRQMAAADWRDHLRRQAERLCKANPDLPDPPPAVPDAEQDIHALAEWCDKVKGMVQNLDRWELLELCGLSPDETDVADEAMADLRAAERLIRQNKRLILDTSLAFAAVLVTAALAHQHQEEGGNDRVEKAEAQRALTGLMGCLHSWMGPADIATRRLHAFNEALRMDLLASTENGGVSSPTVMLAPTCQGLTWARDASRGGNATAKTLPNPPGQAAAGGSEIPPAQGNLTRTRESSEPVIRQGTASHAPSLPAALLATREADTNMDEPPDPRCLDAHKPQPVEAPAPLDGPGEENAADMAAAPAAAVTEKLPAEQGVTLDQVATPPPAVPAVVVDGIPTKALSKMAKALAVLAEHPDWTNAEIAKVAGCHPKSLYRWPKYVQARQIMNAAGKAKMARGRKDSDGSLEAWEE